jgi:hypothetical protein
LYTVTRGLRHQLPGLSKFKLLSDANMLQLPFSLLPLLLAWKLYRKLWLASLR